MIKSVSIRNFMGIESLDLPLTAPLNFISGQNEAGKSSVRDAILWAFTGQARGLKTHADQAAMIREGEKAAEVHVILADGKTFVRRKTPKSNATISGEVPDIGLSPAILFDPYTFLFLPEAQRRELLFQVIPGLNTTVADIYARLGQDERFKIFENDATNPQGASLLAIVKIAVSQGFPAAEKEAVTRRREVKRVLDTLSDTKEPEKTITIDGQEYDIPTLNATAIEGTLKELQAQKDDFLRQKGAREGRVRRQKQITAQLDQIRAMLEPPHEITGIEVEIADLKRSLQEVNEQIAKVSTRQETFPATCPAITILPTPCPNAGQMIGQEPPAIGVITALQQNKTGLEKTLAQATARLQEARRQEEEYRAAMTRKATLEEDLAKLESEPEAGADLDAEIATRGRRIARGRSFQEAIRDYEATLAQFKDAHGKVEACNQEITLYDALAKALAPAGIPSQMIAEALSGVNDRLAEAGAYLFPGRKLCLTPELNIILQNSPYPTLSKSAKFRVGIAFQYALARLAGARWLMIDEADTLDGLHQTELINFLLASLSSFDQIMVFATGDFAAPWSEVPRAQSWWIENGKIAEVWPMVKTSNDLQVSPNPSTASL